MAYVAQTAGQALRMDAMLGCVPLSYHLWPRLRGENTGCNLTPNLNDLGVFWENHGAGCS